MTDTTFEPPYHQPTRGSDVEAFIKAKRDEYDENSASQYIRDCWEALDFLLDRYRLCADTGSRLWEHPTEGHEDP